MRAARPAPTTPTSASPRTALFVDNTLALGLGLMLGVVTLVSFVVVLWSLSGPVTLFGRIPGYMVWVALIYARRAPGSRT